MSSITVTITTNKDAVPFLRAGADKVTLKRLANQLNGLAAGALQGNVKLTGSATDAVAASGTLTLASVIATDACTIGPVTFTFTSTPSTSTATAQDVEVDGADDTADAAALAAAINANQTTKEVVYATSSGAVVTVTARVPGLIGNMIAISDADSTITTSGSGYLAGGTGGSGSLSNPVTISR